MRLFFATFFTLFYIAQVFCQQVSPQKYFLNEIVIKGNNKTKKQIILRELPFREGDSIKITDFDSLKTLAEYNVFNLSLFLRVNISFSIDDSQNCTCSIVVQERFYTLPGFYAELADRTFNEWWFLHQHRINRIDWGFMLNQKNCRGRNETFTALAQIGYSHRFSVLYSIPGIDINRKTGVNLQFQYLANREFAFNTDSFNHLIYLRGNNYLRKRMKSGINFYYRNKIYTLHQVELSFNYNQIEDTVRRLNSFYLGNNIKENHFFSFNYRCDIKHTDIHYYPHKGYHTSVDIEFSGLGLSTSINQIQLSTMFSYYVPLPHKMYYSGALYGIWCSEKNLTFLFSPSFGYDDILVRTYEYYLVKGKTGWLVKNELKLLSINKTLHLNTLRWEKFNEIPVQIYPKLFIDAGYMYDQRNFTSFRLNNQLLMGGGIGIDLVTYYDLVVRIEGGYNRLKEKTLFIHFRKAI